MDVLTGAVAGHRRSLVLGALAIAGGVVAHVHGGGRLPSPTPLAVVVLIAAVWCLSWAQFGLKAAALLAALLQVATHALLAVTGGHGGAADHGAAVGGRFGQVVAESAVHLREDFAGAEGARALGHAVTAAGVAVALAAIEHLAATLAGGLVVLTVAAVVVVGVALVVSTVLLSLALGVDRPVGARLRQRVVPPPRLSIWRDGAVLRRGPPGVLPAA